LSETKRELLDRIAELEERLRESEETIEAIRSGEVDALVVRGPVGEQVFTLKGADRVYRSIVETMGEASVVVDSHGGILYANRQLGTLLNVPAGELTGSSFLALAESDRDRLRAFLDEGFGASAKADFVLKANGASVPVLMSSSPLVLDDGQAAVCLVITDLSHIKKAEADLRKAHDELEQKVEERTKERQRLYDVLETVPAMVCLLTPDYDVPFANRAFREQFGEGKGRKCFDYCFGKQEPCEFCESSKVFQSGEPHRWEVTTPDGHVIDAHDFPFTDVDGSRLILEMDMDITEQRRIEKALRSAYSYNRSLIEASPDPLVTIDPGGLISDVNTATEIATGYSREGSHRDRLLGLFHGVRES